MLVARPEQGRGTLTAVPVNAKLHPRELDFVLSDSGARFAFTDDHWYNAVSAIAPRLPAPLHAVVFGSREYGALLVGALPREIAPVDAATAAWLFYTSGTTGQPKGVVISQSWISPHI